MHRRISLCEDPSTLGPHPTRELPDAGPLAGHENPDSVNPRRDPGNRRDAENQQGERGHELRRRDHTCCPSDGHGDGRSEGN